MNPGIFSNSYVIAAIVLVVGFQRLFTYVSLMQRLFGAAAINPAAWGRIIVISASVLFIVELEKYLLRKYGV